MENIPKRIICVLTVIILLWAHVPVVHAEALPEVMEGTATIADVVMSYYALSGMAVADSNLINTLYNDLGSNFGTIEDLAQQGYLIMNDSGKWEALPALETAIENTSAYQSLQLNELFNVSAQEAATGGGVAATGAATLAGATGCVASTGIIPLVGGVTAAYWGGIAIGTLIAHQVGLYGKQISIGEHLTLNKQILDSIPSGAGVVSYYVSGSDYHPYCYGSIVGATFINNNVINACAVNINDLSIRAIVKTLRVSSGDITQRNQSISPGSYYVVGGDRISNNPIITGCANNFQSQADFLQAVQNWKDGVSQPKKPYSPDAIGENGNLQGESSDSGYIIPDMKPQVDPGVQSGKPLRLRDWLNFANGVKNNNSKTDPFPDNKALFDNILDLIKQNIPGQNPNPEGDPYSPPVITPVPDPSFPDPVPDQPTSENPDESENPQETEPLNPVDTGKPWMLPDLTKKFPFCIPWDIKDCFTLLKSNIRQAPHISWRFNPPNTPIDYTFNLDLSDFEPVAVLLRTLELIAFIAGLAFATRYLIGAS